jgi:hypothetical protein
MKAFGPLVGKPFRLTFSITELFIGNGWAAAGMLRVFGTIKNSEYANTFKGELGDLTSWVKEIHAGVYYHLVRQTLRHILPVLTYLSGQHERVHQLRRPTRLCAGELLR